MSETNETETVERNHSLPEGKSEQPSYSGHSVDLATSKRTIPLLSALKKNYVPPRILQHTNRYIQALPLVTRILLVILLLLPLLGTIVELINVLTMYNQARSGINHITTI